MNTDIFDVTEEQLLSDQAKVISQQEKRIQNLESNLDLNRVRIDTLMLREPYILDSDSNYMSAVAFCNKHSDYQSLRAAYKLDKMADEMCLDLEIRTGQEPSARWGWIKLYPLQVLEECVVLMGKE